jgi:hypothetical protein
MGYRWGGGGIGGGGRSTGGGGLGVGVRFLERGWAGRRLGAQKLRYFLM